MDKNGVVTAWDISTGLCKMTFHGPVKQTFKGHIWLTNGRFIIVWYIEDKWYICDTENTDTRTMKFIPKGIEFRLSGDGSTVFVLDSEFIRAWSIQNRRVMSQVRLGQERKPYFDSFTVNGSKVWVSCEDSITLGWDFGTPDSIPAPLFDVSPVRPCRSHLGFIDGTKTGGLGLSKIEDTVTGGEVFRLVGKYAKPSVTQWDGQYLVAGYKSGEVLILDFNPMSLGVIQAGN